MDGSLGQIILHVVKQFKSKWGSHISAPQSWLSTHWSLSSSHFSIRPFGNRPHGHHDLACPGLNRHLPGGCHLPVQEHSLPHQEEDSALEQLCTHGEGLQLPFGRDWRGGRDHFENSSKLNSSSQQRVACLYHLRWGFLIYLHLRSGFPCLEGPRQWDGVLEFWEPQRQLKKPFCHQWPNHYSPRRCC